MSDYPSFFATCQRCTLRISRFERESWTLSPGVPTQGHNLRDHCTGLSGDPGFNGKFRAHVPLVPLWPDASVEDVERWLVS